ncbi:MFS transporter [Georgenia alba]|uniref:MFS transporter n=1 Tax=Georgenia alba TaxID=2233858 RepID=A0ABW2Q389_9MICO
MRRIVLLLLATVLAIGNFAALMSVVPLWVASGGASNAWVGATTGVMLGGTVAAQLCMVWILRVWSLQRVFAVGTLVLGVATPAYLLTSAVGPVMAISALRGAGFALVVVAGVALAAELAPPGRVGTATGMYGAAAGLPNVVVLPAGVWLSQTWGFSPVFLGAALLALLGVPLAMLLPATDHAGRSRPSVRGMSRGSVVALVTFFVTTASLGTVLTFLPLSATEADRASAALLVLSVAMVLARIVAGSVADRYGPGRLVVPAAMCCAVGFVVLALDPALDGWLVLAGAAVLGAGFGLAQNDSFLVVLRSLGARRSGSASTVWNIAYDGGMGLGPVVVGAGLALTGYAGAFAALTALLTLAAVVALLVGGRSMGTDDISPAS